MNNIVEKLTSSWNSGNVAKIAALYADNGTIAHPLVPQPLQGRSAIQQFEQGMFDSFTNVEWQALSVCEGKAGELCVEFAVAAVNTKSMQTPKGPLPPTNKRVAVKGVSLLKLNGKGEIVEERRYFDTGSFFVQLGLA